MMRTMIRLKPKGLLILLIDDTHHHRLILAH